MKTMDPQTQIQTRKPTTITTHAMRRSQSSNYYDSTSTTPTHLDSPHSPLRFHSPLRSDHGDPPDLSPYASPESSPSKPPPPDSSKAVALDKFSPLRPDWLPPPSPEKSTDKAPGKAEDSVVVVNRAVREEGVPAVRKVGPVEGEGGQGRAVSAILRRSKRGEMMRMAELGFRVCEAVCCLISFSVMAADKTQGWSGDSFDRYKEYRYCLSVNVIAFVYSGFQSYDLAYHLITEKHVINHHLRYHFDFFMDQILAYLLISASSAAATRVDDWQSNWGKDEFTIMASASIAMAFLAFAAFAISSLFSGYNLCNRDST